MSKGGSESEAANFLRQRDDARAQRDEMRRQRDEARAQRDEARSQRDEMRGQRDEAMRQRDHARSQRAEALEQRDEARAQRDSARRRLERLQHIREGQDRAAQAWREQPQRHERLSALARRIVLEQGIHAGRVLEIGGRENPHDGEFVGFDYLNLDIEATGEGVLQGDITRCPEIPDESFDVVLSVDVFEHIDRPWLAAAEIVRLLKPGGVTFHSTLFSWRYHPCPIDYWRYTPESLTFLFSELRCVLAEFDDTERRRNILGKGTHRISPDAFGGWRENWRVHYAGVKV